VNGKEANTDRSKRGGGSQGGASLGILALLAVAPEKTLHDNSKEKEKKERFVSAIGKGTNSVQANGSVKKWRLSSHL